MALKETPVDYDPFAVTSPPMAAKGYREIPVDYDPFAAKPATVAKPAVLPPPSMDTAVPVGLEAGNLTNYDIENALALDAAATAAGRENAANMGIISGADAIAGTRPPKPLPVLPPSRATRERERQLFDSQYSRDQVEKIIGSEFIGKEKVVLAAYEERLKQLQSGFKTAAAAGDRDAATRFQEEAQAIIPEYQAAIGRFNATVQSLREGAPLYTSEFSDPWPTVLAKTGKAFFPRVGQGLAALFGALEETSPNRELFEKHGAGSTGMAAAKTWGQIAEEASPVVVPGTPKAWVSGALESVALNAPMALAGMASGSLALPLVGMGLIAGGQKYAELREKRPDIAIPLALSVAAGSGTMEGLTELIPLKTLLRTDIGIGKKLVNEMFQEIPTEMANTIYADLQDKMTTRPNMTWGDFLQDEIDTIMTTAIATPIMVGSTHKAVKYLERKRKEAIEADQKRIETYAKDVMADEAKLKQFKENLGIKDEGQPPEGPSASGPSSARPQPPPPVMPPPAAPAPSEPPLAMPPPSVPPRPVLPDGWLANRAGYPYKTEKSATEAMAKKGLAETHEVVAYENGFALKPKEEPVKATEEKTEEEVPPPPEIVQNAPTSQAEGTKYPVSGVKLYHSSDVPILDINPELYGSKTDEGLLGKGFYLSTDKNIGQGKGITSEFETSIESPLVVEYPEWGSDKAKLVSDAIGIDRASGEQLTKELISRGYDSVVLDYAPVGYDHKEVAIFDKAKLKPTSIVGEAPPSRRPVLPPPTKVSGEAGKPSTKTFVENKIRQLGSIEAVNAFYSGDDAISQYARQEAPKILGIKEKEPTTATKKEKKLPYGRSGVSVFKKIAATANLSEENSPDYDDFVSFFEQYYNAGVSGKDMPAIDMHPQDAHAAYQAGRDDAKKDQERSSAKKPVLPPPAKEGDSKFKEGDRVVVDGKHGSISAVDTLVMRPIVGGGESRSYHYRVKLDSGREILPIESKIEREIEKPTAEIIPDVLVDGRYEDPEGVVNRYGRTMQKAREARARASRARSDKKRYDILDEAVRYEKDAAATKSAFIAWAKENPEAAKIWAPTDILKGADLAAEKKPVLPPGKVTKGKEEGGALTLELLEKAAEIARGDSLTNIKGAINDFKEGDREGARLLASKAQAQTATDLGFGDAIKKPTQKNPAPPALPLPAKAKTETLIGKNSEGEDVYEDNRGVRYTIENGFKSFESVRMVPTRGGIVLQTPSPRDERYKTVEETVKGLHANQLTATDLFRKTSDKKSVLDTNGIKLYDNLGDARKALEAIGPRGSDEKLPQYLLKLREYQKAATPEPPKAFGADNKIFTEDKAAKAREILRKKLGGLNMGVPLDPEIIQAGIDLAGYYIEGGSRSFVDYSTKMISDLGDVVRPYLKSFYMAVRNYPGFDKAGMNNEAELDEIGENVVTLEDKKALMGMLEGGDLVHYKKSSRGMESGNFIANKGKYVLLRGGASTVEVYPEEIIKAERDGKPIDITEKKVTLESKEEGEEDAVRTRDAAGKIEDDRAGIEGPGPEDVRGSVEVGEPETVPEGSRRGNDGELHGSNIGSLGEDRTEGLPRPGEENTSLQHGPKRPVAASSGDMAGIQRPDARDFRILHGSIERTGSWKETASRNLDIIQLVKALEQENRLATPEEQALLARYTGWGAGEIRNKIFSTYRGESKITVPKWGDTSWNPLIERANDLLSPDEIKTAARSTQYAHYTSEKVARSIWSAIERMGFPGGRVFEPGMGIGNFAGLMPESIYKNSSYTGIEFDHMTAAIAKQLYQMQTVMLGDYTKQKFANNFFDLAIGNPPFSQTKILADPDYKKHAFSLHDYFFAKTIDKVRPGGMLVFITSHYTMDKGSDKARAYLAERADLIGAIRMPQTAFKESAGTEVVTDVLFLRKREAGQEPGGHPWEKLAEVEVEDGNKALINEYFAAHPEMVLGTNSMKGKMYSKNEYTVMPKEGDIEEQFAQAIENLPENVYSVTKRPAAEQKEIVTERDFNPKNKKEGGIYVSDKGELMRVSYGSGKSLLSEEKLSPTEVAWLKEYIPLRDQLKQARYDQFMDGDWEKSLAALNNVYNAFVKKHGHIKTFSVIERSEVDEDGNKQVVEYRRYKYEKLALLDVEGPLVLALEKVTEDGEIAKDHILLGRTIKKPVQKEIKSIGDALAVSLDERGSLDLDHVATLLNQPSDTITEQLGDLVYENPSGTWELADEYLSGDVVTKLEEAEAAAKSDSKYLRNVKALVAVQPKPLAARDITVRLGANWVKPEYVADFAEEVLGTTMKVEYIPAANYWRVTFGAPETPSYYRRRRTANRQGKQSLRGDASEWSTPDRGANELLEAALNQQKVVIRVTVDAKTKKTEVDQAATTAANEKIGNMLNRFRSWIWEDADRAADIIHTYNRKFNNIAPRKFDGSHLTLPGVSARFNLHPHQKRAVWRIIQSGNTYLAHAVGAGKTMEAIAAGMEMRRLGMVQKPMYVVPNHMLAQFSGEFMELYPMANIMVATEENFHTTNRKKFMAQAAVNDPDAIVITHSSFGLLNMKPENVAATRDEILSDLRMALTEMEDSGESRFLIRRMEQRIEQAEQRFDSIVGGAMNDHTVDFEDMVIDFLFVDEAHEFRKLDFHTNQQIKGIDPVGSRRALDLYLKTKYLDAKKPGRSHVFMSGTPVTNTMGELYTVSRFFDEQGMDRDGIKQFDAWAANFGQTAADYEPNAAGRYELVTRFAKFQNIPELSKRIRQFMDVLTSEELAGYVTIPSVVGGGPQNVLALPSPELERYQREVLQRRLEISRAWKPTSDEPNNPDPVINIITDGRLASIDARFFNPKLTDDKGSKLNKMIDEIIKDYKKLTSMEFTEPNGKPAQKKGATQIVFYNHGFGKAVAGRRGFDAKKWVNNRLKAAGVPLSEVGWLDDYDTGTKKAALFRDMRNGAKKIIIGSAKKMGTGMNIQKRLKVLHYLDPPWYPSDVEQPHGRILRQGNQNPEVEIKWYATKGTYDSAMWQMVARKNRFITQFFRGDESIRTMEDISEVNQYEMARALSSGDERVIKLVELEGKIQKLSLLKEAHAAQQNQLRWDRSSLEHTNDMIRKRIAELRKAEAVIGGGYVHSFKADIGRQKGIDSNKELGEAVIGAYNKAAASLPADTEEAKEYGTINGVSLIAISVKSFYGEWKKLNIVRITPKVSYEVNEGMEYPDGTDAVGLGRRIINRLNKVHEEISEKEHILDGNETKLRQIAKRIGAPYEHEQELAEKVAELAQLQGELASEGTTEEDIDLATLRPQARDTWEDYQDRGGDRDEYPIWAAKVARAKAILSQHGEGSIEDAQSLLDEAKQQWEENNDWPENPEYPQEIITAQNIITSIRQGQGKLFTSGGGGGITLYGGLIPDPIAVAKAFREAADDIKAAIPHLEALGRAVFDAGKQTYEDWTRAMKRHLGELWAKFKGYLEDIWKNAKAMNQRQKFKKLFDKKDKERGSISFKKKTVLPQPGHKFESPETEALFQSAKGIKKETVIEKIKAVATEIGHKIARDYEHLANSRQNAPLIFILKRLEKQRDVVADRTAREIGKVLSGLDKSEYDIFARKVILDDLLADVERGKYDNEKELPFKFTAESLAAEKERLDALVDENPKIAAALAKRKAMWEVVKGEYIDALKPYKANVEDMFKENYYRHQVLDYVESNGIFGTGSKRLAFPVSRGYTKERTGYAGLYNTDYLEAEHNIMAQMLYDIEMAEALTGIKSEEDISAQVKAKAKEKNFENLVGGPKNLSEIRKLEGQLAELRESGSMDSEDKKIAKGIIERLNELDPTRPFKQKIAMSFAKLRKLGVIDDTDIDYGGDLPGGIFSKLSELMDQEGPWQKPIATIFKAIRERENLMRQTLGAKYLEWQHGIDKRAIPPGYTAWQPREGNVFYPVLTVDEKTAAAIMAGELDKLAPGSGEIFKKAMAVGGKRTQWIVRDEVAETLSNLTRERAKGIISSVDLKVMVAWKKWQLISPRRMIKYNIRNLTGDAEATFLGNPAGFGYVPQAIRELYAVFVGKQPMSADMLAWFTRGGMSSTLQAQEMDALKQAWMFTKLHDKEAGFLKNAWQKYWKVARLSTDFRESILRYASFLSYKEQLKKNGGKRPDNYGASKPETIDALDNIDDKAFWLSNDLLGAYDRVSVFGQWIRERAIPFWSWQEVNMKRYVQLFRNAADNGELATAIGKKAGITSLYAARKVGGFLIKAAAFAAILAVYNNLFWPDEEEKLPWDVRMRAHIILGKDADGNIEYFSRMGTLDDFLSWFGLDYIPKSLNDLLSGKSIKDVASAQAVKSLQAAPNKAVQGAVPFSKLGFELITRRSTFPDIFRPGAIRDRYLHIARSFGLENEYIALAGKPSRGYGESLNSLFMYKVNPNEADYRKAFDLKRDFLKKMGKEVDGFWITPDGDALYNMRLAMRYDDREAFRKYFMEYVERKIREGKDDAQIEQGIKRSLKSMHPVSGMSRGMQEAFARSLTDEEMKIMHGAVRFYYDVLEMGDNDDEERR